MLNTLKIVWRVSKEYEMSILDSNLFLFKFASVKDKERVLDGAPWTFEKQLLVFHEYDGNLRPSDYIFNKGTFWITIYDLSLNLMSTDMAEMIGNKIGVLKRVDHNTRRLGWGRNLRLRVEIDVTKQLRRFITILRGNARDDVWGRHGKFECPVAGERGDNDGVKQYGDWLIASPGARGNLANGDVTSNGRRRSYSANLWGKQEVIGSAERRKEGARVGKSE
ncbi:hypothetical protein PTKIN_Ptkin16aG0079600 [Pterospermum kingtungense]